jgi:peptidoglycan/LPS O-acetylase OafA/YrhL
MSRFGPGAFRLFLALLVVISHLRNVEVGRVAVIAFFVLSGYWVVTMYRRKYLPMAAPVTSFLFSRLLRLFPIYLLMVALTLAARSWFYTVPGVTVYDLVLLGLANQDERLIAPAWSLDIEMQFYTIVPLLVLMLGTSPTLAKLAITAVVSAVITALCWTWTEPRFAYFLGPFLIAFIVGAIFSYRPPQVSRFAAYAGLVVFFLLGLLMLVHPQLQALIIKTRADWINRDIVALVWSVPLLPFIAWNVQQKSGPADRVFGELAYTLYLMHWLVIMTVARALGMPKSVLWDGVRIAASLGGAYVVYLYFDRPIEKLRRRVFEKADRVRPAAAETPSRT